MRAAFCHCPSSSRPSIVGGCSTRGTATAGRPGRIPVGASPPATPVCAHADDVVALVATATTRPRLTPRRTQPLACTDITPAPVSPEGTFTAAGMLTHCPDSLNAHEVPWRQVLGGLLFHE